MKNKFIQFILFISMVLLGQGAFSQEPSVKFQFSILSEDGDIISDLKLSDIQILQDKKPLLLKSLESKAESPLEVVMMVDASASQERLLPVEKKIAESIIDEILVRGKDKVAIVKFSGEIGLMQDLTDSFSQAKRQLNLIEFEPPVGFVGGGIVASNNPPNPKQAAKGSTSIWDSIGDVTKALGKVKNHNSRQVVILISDGVNTYGDSKLKEAIYSSLKNQIPVYAVGIGDDFYSGVDKKTLRKLTEQTAGILIVPDEKGKDLDKQITTLRKSLHSGYEVTFTPNQNLSKDILQEIKVEIINPDLNKKKTANYSA